MISFQFHSGSIKTRGAGSLAARRAGFNSTLVRLRLAAALGAGRASEKSFNSTLVRLRQGAQATVNAAWKAGFNSTLVRLRRDRDLRARRRGDAFQFHSGSIKTCFTTRGGASPEVRFQFHSGSIKTFLLKPSLIAVTFD